MNEGMKGLKTLLIVILISFVLAGLWDKVAIIKLSVGYILNPTFGNLLNFNFLFGIILISFIITLILTLLQKFLTDQDALKNLKEEGKEIQKKMKEFRDHPDKILELQKRQFANLPKTFELTMKPLVYYSIPLILFFRWFSDYFSAMGNPKIFIWFGWLGSYIIFSIVFSIILRKLLKVH